VGRLFWAPDVRIWRANWITADWTGLIITSHTSKVIERATALIIEASLDMYSVATQRERRSIVPTPAAAKTRSSHHSSAAVRAQYGSFRLTDYGFTVARPAPPQPTTGTFKEPP
jgi:hypothetical protein